MLCVQYQVLLMTKPIKEKALREFYCREQPTTICIADLGCSSAEQNTLNLISDFIDTIEKARRELGNNGTQEYQVYLNDLPNNDFNTLFRSLGKFDAMLKQNMGNDFGHYFVNGVPGSFYGRLFPSNHLHFVHSSYSLHWLSQVPKGIENNKRNIYIGRASPPNVLKAYYEQYEKDFSTFLKCRSEEVVPGGIMVLTMLGRKSIEPYSKETCYIFDSLATALNDMVHEGLLEEEKLNTFNMPIYIPSAQELNSLVDKEGSFTLNETHISEVSWEMTVQDDNSCKSLNHDDFANCMRAVAEPLVAHHFGQANIEEMLTRYKKISKALMAKEKKNVLTN
ncbi:Salicylate carboxymethyltransferase, partial [Bienertia sinuspersici]